MDANNFMTNKGNKQAGGVPGAAAAQEFLKLLTQTVRLTALYGRRHPVPTAGANEVMEQLKSCCAAMRSPAITIGFTDGKWILGDSVLAAADKMPGAVHEILQEFMISKINFQSSVQAHEISALCALLAVPEGNRGSLEPAGFLKQNGVSRIRLFTEGYTKVEQTARPKPIAPPIPDASAKPAGAAKSPDLPDAGKGRNLGIFIKQLVESSVQDPDAQAQIYSQAVRTVREALEERIRSETKVLRKEAADARFVQARAQDVFQQVAGGKVILDKDGRIIMMDHAAEKVSGKRLVEVAGMRAFEAFDTGEHMSALAPELTEKDSKPNADSQEVMTAFRQSLALLKDESGNVVGTVGILPNVAKFREAVLLQEEFVAHVTHELKAPLASVCSAMELIGEIAADKLGKEEKRFLEISKRNVSRLRVMIDEILDFSKLQSGQMTANPIKTDLKAILDEAVEGMKPLAVSREVEILTDLEEGAAPLLVYADHARIVQVLTNLISNAIKATPKAGAVTIGSDQGTGPDTGSMTIRVTDSGEGISAEDQEVIFEKFRQGANPKNRKEGVGLGLTIVKSLLSLHGSQINLDSEVGKGSTFSFSLKKA